MPESGKTVVQHEHLPLGDVARGNLRYEESTNALVLRGRNGDHKARIELLDRFAPFLRNLLRAIENEYRVGRDTTLEGNWTIERNISIFEICERFGCRENAFFFAEDRLENIAFNPDCPVYWDPKRGRDFRAFLGRRDKPGYGWLWIHRQILREMGRDPAFSYDSHESKLVAWPRYTVSFTPDEDLERAAYARRARVVGPWYALPEDGLRGAATKLRVWLLSEHSRDWVEEAFDPIDLEILDMFCQGFSDAMTIEVLRNTMGVKYTHPNQLNKRREDILIRLARLRHQETARFAVVTEADYAATRLYNAISYSISTRAQHETEDENDPDSFLGYEHDDKPEEEVRWTDILAQDDALEEDDDGL